MPFANNQGVRIHYEVEGQGPPLMLGHGFGSSLESVRGVGYVQALKDEYQLLLVDARGHGASDKPHEVEAYSLELMVGDLVAVLDDLGISKAHYFGYSMGGRIGFRIPIYASERFASLVLGGAPYPLPGHEDAQDEILVALSRALEFALSKDADKAMEIYVAMIEERAGPMPASLRNGWLANDASALFAANQAFRETVSPSASEVLPRMALPCLLFVGEADPRYLSVKECASRMPNASFFSLPGLDHVPAGLRIDLTMPHIKEFLARVNKEVSQA